MNSIISLLGLAISFKTLILIFYQCTSSMHILNSAPHSVVTEKCYFKKKRSSVSLNLGNWIIILVKEFYLCDKMSWGRENVNTLSYCNILFFRRSLTLIINSNVKLFNKKVSWAQKRRCVCILWINFVGVKQKNGNKIMK